MNNPVQDFRLRPSKYSLQCSCAEKNLQSNFAILPFFLIIFWLQTIRAISTKNKLVITKWADFITKHGNYVITFWADILLQNAAAFYKKTSRCYYKTQQLLQNEPFLLQNAAVITKRTVYYKTGHNSVSLLVEINRVR